MRPQPHLLEINAVCFLHNLSEKYGKKLTLSEIPAQEWAAIAARGFDSVWIMGVWERSPGARKCAFSEPDLLKECRAVLTDFKETDMVGSPYAIYGYEIDPILGGNSCLLKLKENLHKSGLSLILDFVPNHLASDHPWTKEHPECFVEVLREISLENPGLFFETPSGHFLAHGRDPYFSPWADTVQINYDSPEARSQAVETLLKIAGIASGVRCDMAMLGISRVFENTWGRFLKNRRPEKEFWKDVIGKVRTQYPDFIFIAEAYWDLEWEMQQLGFNFTYDKKLYDRLRHSEPSEIRGHLSADLGYQEHSVRFIENHDEPRALTAFGLEKSCAAAVITATIPGMRFFQEGQAEGKQVRVPVQLGREPREKENPDTVLFYKKLWEYAGHKCLHEGKWELSEICPAGANDSNHHSLLSWSWRQGRELRLVVINYSAASAQGRVFFPGDVIPGAALKLTDVLTGNVYERNPKEIKEKGLYVDLKPWQAHLFEAEFK